VRGFPNCTSDGLTGFTIWILLGAWVATFLIAACARFIKAGGLFGLNYLLYEDFR
jgi:threonine/homoserine/homoserine lactone efflux protein